MKMIINYCFIYSLLGAMQLFVTEYIKKDKNIILTDRDLLSQLRKVLRASIGDTLWVQNIQREENKMRYEIRIEVWDNKILEGTIVSEQSSLVNNEKRSMIIAMPNKWDKIELIVQKLTECSLDQIVFWPSERSVIKEWNQKKEERLHKIMKEALEQSWGRNMPELIFTTTPKDLIGNNPLVVFDKETKTAPLQKAGHIYGLIGPEGGLTYRDYQTFAGTSYDIYGLGETILRTETAAIIGGRCIKNSEKMITKE